MFHEEELEAHLQEITNEDIRNKENTKAVTDIFFLVMTVADIQQNMSMNKLRSHKL